MARSFASPLPGIFYRRPSPDQPPFKEVGDMVAIGDPVGVVEVMKTFAQVQAEEAGRLVRFLVDDDAEVSAGEPLYELE